MTPTNKPENSEPSVEETGDSIAFEAEAPPSALGADPLQKEIDRLKEENAKLRDQWVRAVADAENIRKRAQRDMEDTARYGVTNFARDMVSVLENLTRASESIPAEAASDNELLKTLREGIHLTLQELLSIFEKYGIKRVMPLNQKFDHNLHQAVAQAPREDVPAGTVVQVIQSGYIIHDRLLRPAMVVVSQAVDPAKKVDTTA